MTTTRKFEDKPAVRVQVPLLVGLVGPSGGGKTGSALELAHGFQQVSGGEIFYIDTEANRALHYAGMTMFSDPTRKFQFRHISFKAPFAPSDYEAAITHCISKRAKTIIVDSMSHEHEGPGGVLEMHEAELTRMAGADNYEKRGKMTMLAWQKPKAERRHLINSVLQMGANFIFCFRAKEKMKMIPGKNPVALGWQPIAGEEFVFEMMLNCLLPPGAGGVPSWMPEEPGERQMVKLPQQFKALFTENKPLSAATGVKLAQWAYGGAPALAPAPAPGPGPAPEVAQPPAEVAPPPAPAPEAAKPAKKPIPADALFTVGPLEDTMERTGVTDGKPWKKIGFKIGGQWFGSFDTGLESWFEFKGKAGSLKLFWKQAGEFKNVLGIEFANEAAAPSEGGSPI